MKRTLLVLSMFLMTASACGYLDDDLLVDDEQFEQSFTFEGLSISGSSGWGCGGRGHFSRRHGRAPNVVYGAGGLGITSLMSGYRVSMTDQQLLELTNVDEVDLGEGDEPGTVSVPAEVYYEAMATRNETLGTIYD